MSRITGGRLRGRVLPAPVARGVRPTASRVREAVFSMIGQDLTGSSMLDLFGGTGLVAIEAASRGAHPVVVVERSPEAAAAILRNAATLDAELAVRVGDASRIQVEAADIVYVDPPYREAIGPWVARAGELCRAVLVVELRAPSAWPEAPDGFRLDRARRYGDTGIAVYRRDG